MLLILHTDTVNTFPNGSNVFIAKFQSTNQKYYYERILVARCFKILHLEQKSKKLYFNIFCTTKQNNTKKSIL